MDILDDLDINIDLPDGFDFSLDEILAEFSVTGLFSASEPVPELPTAPEIDVPAEPEPEPDPVPEVETPAVPEQSAREEDDGAVFEISDILLDFGTPVDEDGVKLYTPTVQLPTEGEDDVKVFVPKSEQAEETVPFTPIQVPEAPQGELSAPTKKKRLSWRERRAARKQAKAMKTRAASSVGAVTPAPETPAPEAEDETSLLDTAEFIAAQLEEEERARAQLEAAMEAQAEAELFAWLDSNGEAVPELPAEPVPQAEPLPVPEPADDPGYAEYPTLAPDTEEGPGVLLENPDIDPEGQEAPEAAETEEERAARKAKEEDDLHYTPEDSPAQAVAAAAGKKLSGLLSIFTDTDAGCQEEDLGPEVEPGKASRFFHKYIKGYRFRLRIATVLCLVVGWISMGLPVFGSMKNTAVASAACLMILLTVMLLGADVLAAGFRSVLRGKPGAHGLVFLSCAASVIDAAVIVMCKGEGGYLPFCAVSAVSMAFAIYGSLLYCRGQRLNFRSLELSAEPMTICVDYGMVEPETTTVYRTPGHPEGYIHRSEEEDLSESLFGILGPLLMVAVPVLALLSAIADKALGDFFHIMAGMFASTAAFSALVAFPLPYYLTQRDLFRAKASIAGWAGTRDLGRVSTMIVTDRDLFPDETVSIQSVRIVDHVPPQLTLSYMCSLVIASGSCLVPAFTQLAENNGCDILTVENFQCHEAGGLSCEIGPDRVLVASHSYMKLQGFRIPARKKDSENALFLAVNDHVIAYIIVDYKPVKSVRAGLQTALQGSAELVFAARDFNITPLLISKKFKSPTDTLRFPSYAQRYEITGRADSDTAVCAAVVSRKSLYPYAAVVSKARNLYRSVTAIAALSVVSALLGVLLCFIMALTGAGAAVSVSKLMVYMLAWLVPTLVLSIGINQ